MLVMLSMPTECWLNWHISHHFAKFLGLCGTREGRDRGGVWDHCRTKLTNLTKLKSCTTPNSQRHRSTGLPEHWTQPYAQSEPNVLLHPRNPRELGHVARGHDSLRACPLSRSLQSMSEYCSTPHYPAVHIICTTNNKQNQWHHLFST